MNNSPETSDQSEPLAPTMQEMVDEAVEPGILIAAEDLVDEAIQVLEEHYRQTRHELGHAANYGLSPEKPIDGDDS